MKNKVFLTASLVLTVAFTANAQLPPCGVVTTDTKLQSDCEAPMVVAGDNITVDLNGHAVRCTGGDPARTGIDIMGVSKIRIRDGTITLCGRGIRHFQGDDFRFEKLNVIANSEIGIDSVVGNNFTIRDCNVSFNGAAGISMQGATGHKVLNNVIHANGFVGLGFLGLDSEIRNNTITAHNRGIYVNASSITIEHNEISGNMDGIFLDDGRFVRIERNSIHDNTDHGIFHRAFDAVIQDNEVNDNGTGIETTLSHVNLIERNVTNNNTLRGINLGFGTSQTTVRRNQADHNGSEGILVESVSTLNTITQNSAHFNGVDLSDLNPNCDANVWVDNDFDTKFAVPPSCID